MNTESYPKRRATGETPELKGDILDRAMSGDHGAFTQIVHHYEQMVFNFSFKVCRDRAYAEETLQDTFVNVYKKLNQFDKRSKFSTWLYSIVANNCLMKRRRRKLEEESVSINEPELPHDHEGSHADSLGSPLHAWQGTPLDESMNTELRTLLDEAIQKLPLDYRLVFILRDLEGRSVEETAKVMKLSLAATKSRLRRARVFLREQLNGYMSS
jgi:RNA polymerase sigma-70 factor, ECF subfamily